MKFNYDELDVGEARAFALPRAEAAVVAFRDAGLHLMWVMQEVDEMEDDAAFQQLWHEDLPEAMSTLKRAGDNRAFVEITANMMRQLFDQTEDRLTVDEQVNAVQFLHALGAAWGQKALSVRGRGDEACWERAVMASHKKEDGDSTQMMFFLPSHIHRKFKITCVLEEVTMKDKLTELVLAYLRDH